MPERRVWRCKHLNGVEDRQARVTGWDQRRLAETVGVFFGAGGVNSEILYGCARKGLGVAHVSDSDVVSRTNLNRQFFRQRDLWKNKAICLCKNLSNWGFLGTTLVAHPCDSTGIDIDELKTGFVVCSVDLRIPGTRVQLCQQCHELRIPVIFVALNADADQGYVFIQRPRQACWACAFRPESSVSDEVMKDSQCPGVAATIDLTKMLAGLACYAIDTLVMERPINWNYRMVSMSDGGFGSGLMIPPRPDCRVCGGS